MALFQSHRADRSFFSSRALLSLIFSFYFGSLQLLPIAESASSGRVGNDFPVNRYEAVTPSSQSLQIRPVDGEPLASRTPLFLIHGIGGANADDYKWTRFLQFTAQSQDFHQRFKLYWVAYEPQAEIEDLGKALISAFESFYRQHPSAKPFRVLALSQGGIVFREAAKSHWVSSHTDKIISLASPLEGSPLAAPDWMLIQMKQYTPRSLIRLLHGVIYAIVRLSVPHLQQNFSPETAHNQETQDGVWAAATVLDSKQKADTGHLNWITYGSYFGTSPAQEARLQLALHPGLVLDKQNLKPSDSIAVPRPNHFILTKHGLFELLQQQLSRLQPKSTDNPKQMLTFNDGLAPIDSSLWLNRFHADDWTALKQVQGTGQVRLFSAMDHASWMEGYPLNRQATSQDILNPQEASKPIYQWVIDDLMS